MNKTERIIAFIESECEHCKANVDVLGNNNRECMNADCFEAHSYAIEAIRFMEENK